MVADQKVWADKMFQYADRMSVFESADLIEIEPVLRESVKKVVQVTMMSVHSMQMTVQDSCGSRRK